MRRSIRLFVTLVLGLLLNAILVNYANATIRIMPLGDSITRGVTGSSEDTGYRRELFLSLVQTGYQLNFVGSLSDGTPGDFDDDHEGHSGFHADGSPAGDGNDIFDNVLDWLIDQQNFGNPTDIVLLHIGTNDITNGGEDANEVDAILDEIYQYDPNTWVILARIINRVNYSQETTDFNNSVEAMVQNRIILGDNLLLVDMEDGAGIIYSDQPGGDMVDDIHPNDTGYDKIANMWFPAVQQVTQPVADAGPDQSVDESDIVTLDGSNSKDPDGIITSYLWEQIVGTSVVLSDDQAVQPTFTAPDVGSTGDTLIFRLTVTDNDNFESNDTCVVNLSCSDNIFYRDADGDGYGDPSALTQACTQPSGYVLDDTDCDDTDPNEHPNQAWYRDSDSDGYSDGATNASSCTRPTGYKVASELIATSGDCDDTNPSIHPGASEVCNGKDDDCDGSVDEGVDTTYFRDADGDGYGGPNNSTKACSQPSGYILDNTDCDDSDPLEHPNQTWYKDFDNDRYSDGTTDTSSCIRPAGYKVASELTGTSGDCDDNDPNQHPGASEVCNGKDDDCDGSIDEGVQTTYFRDADSDGYGDPNNWTKACSLPSAYVINNLDCDDNDPKKHPDQTWYKDLDYDGYSDGSTNTTSCTRPIGFKVSSELISTSGDCDDTDPNEHPNQIWYKDADSDGYSDGSTNTVSCTRPIGFKVVSELTATSGDCDDNDQNQNPGAPEVCNWEDDDCDNEIDEACIGNNPPEADAGSNQTVAEGETVKLDGSKSSDPDPGDNIVSYQWTQVGGIPATLSDPTAAKPTFITPVVSPGGMILTFELVVKDNWDLQDSAQVTVTVNDNGISGFPDDVLTMTCSTGKEIGIKLESDLVSITAVDPDTIPDSSDKPDNLPYGLLDLLIKTDAVGGSAKVTFYLENPAGVNDKWSKHKTSTGNWEDCSAYASFNAARDRVTLTLVDGGDGDDGPADGWIVDPSGLSSSAATTSSGGGGGGGGGCFIDTAADS